MAIIPRSQRTNLPPGGRGLPSPSFINVNIAGQRGKSIADAGTAIHKVNILAQRANDNAEFKTEIINTEVRLNTELARIKQEQLDPDLYEAEARKAINNIEGDVNFRNKKRFNNIVQRLRASANIAVSKEKFGKVADKGKAAHVLLKDTVVQDIATGKLTQAQGIAIVAQSTNELTSNGIFDQENKVAEDRGFGGRVAEVAFESRFPTDPIGAIDELNNNKNITSEVKQNLIDKETRKFNLRNKQLKEAKRLGRMERVKDFKVRARRGEVTEDELIQDAKDHPANPMSVDEFSSLLNDVNKVEKAGGVGNGDKFNEMMTDIRRNPDMFSINDIYEFEDQNDLNAEQSQSLEDQWGKLVIGTSDPNDITTFRDFKEGIKFTNLFAPGRFDVGAQLGVKKLRFDQAYGFARAKAVELFKTNKDVDSVMSQVEFETLKHMKEYDSLVQEFIDSGELDPDESSIFEVKQLVEPKLEQRAEKEAVTPEKPVMTDEQLDEIEAIFDKADTEDRELSEAEVQKINEIQESNNGDNT